MVLCNFLFPPLSLYLQCIGKVLSTFPYLQNPDTDSIQFLVKQTSFFDFYKPTETHLVTDGYSLITDTSQHQNLIKNNFKESQGISLGVHNKTENLI